MQADPLDDDDPFIDKTIVPAANVEAVRQKMIGMGMRPSEIAAAFERFAEIAPMQADK